MGEFESLVRNKRTVASSLPFSLARVLSSSIILRTGVSSYELVVGRRKTETMHTPEMEEREASLSRCAAPSAFRWLELSNRHLCVLNIYQ